MLTDACRVNLLRFMKEAAVLISKLDITWVPRAFAYVLTHAVEALSLKDI